jgi:hypothetical protein
MGLNFSLTNSVVFCCFEQTLRISKIKLLSCYRSLSPKEIDAVKPLKWPFRARRKKKLPHPQTETFAFIGPIAPMVLDCRAAGGDWNATICAHCLLIPFFLRFSS